MKKQTWIFCRTETSTISVTHSVFQIFLYYQGQDPGSVTAAPPGIWSQGSNASMLVSEALQLQMWEVLLLKYDTHCLVIFVLRGP